MFIIVGVIFGTLWAPSVLFRIIEFFLASSQPFPYARLFPLCTFNDDRVRHHHHEIGANKSSTSRQWRTFFFLLYTYLAKYSPCLPIWQSAFRYKTKISSSSNWNESGRRTDSSAAAAEFDPSMLKKNSFDNGALHFCHLKLQFTDSLPKLQAGLRYQNHYYYYRDEHSSRMSLLYILLRSLKSTWADPETSRTSTWNERSQMVSGSTKGFLKTDDNVADHDLFCFLSMIRFSHTVLLMILWLLLSLGKSSCKMRFLHGLPNLQRGTRL